MGKAPYSTQYMMVEGTHRRVGYMVTSAFAIILHFLLDCFIEEGGRVLELPAQAVNSAFFTCNVSQPLRK
jgi:hypothetical protein